MWLFALISVPLVLSLIDCARDVYCDTALIRTVALRSEMNRLRHEALRRAGRLESLVEALDQQDVPVQSHGLASISENPQLRAEWNQSRQGVPYQIYSALVDPSGKIILHTDPAAIGRTLTSEWDDHKESEAGSDVVRLQPGVLSGQSPAYDVHVPLQASGRQLGQFHVGLDAAWFEGRVAAEQRELLIQRSWLIALLVAANLGGVAGLVVLARNYADLRSRLVETMRGQTRLLAQIGMGLAHEIRNPLHALRINVHTLRRSLGRAPLSEQELTDIMRESDDEIDRLDGLVRDFVQYTVPQSGERNEVDLGQEVQATLNLLGEEMRRKQISLVAQIDPQPARVRIDSSRLRQVALHLLTFAQRSSGGNGTIEVNVSRKDKCAELLIAGSGPALSDSDQARLFEPFQATAHSDAGLRMALIRRFVEEAGGIIDLARQRDMNCFRVRLPLNTRVASGT